MKGNNNMNDDPKRYADRDSPTCKKRIEKLMNSVIGSIGNQSVGFYTLADKARRRALTEHESELIRNMTQVFKMLIKQRFLEEIADLEGK